jgi:hypothetical protein
MSQQASVAFNQFPQIVWRDNEKKLWNPIHRKMLKNRPEERVRLRVLEYLIRGGWSIHRISTEEMIGSFSTKEEGKRADLICYTQAFDPFLLVECKAENIKLSPKTALQIAGYNRSVEAPFLLLTNGRTDYWYKPEENKPLKALVKIPEQLSFIKENDPNEDYNFWKERGFAGSEASPELRTWLKQVLNETLMNGTASTRYLSFKQQPFGSDLSHYYQIYKLRDCQMALGFMATEYGGSRLTGIFNKNGKNEAVIEINLDFLFDDRSPNASIYAADSNRNVDIRPYTGQLLNENFNGQKVAEKISSELMQFDN